MNNTKIMRLTKHKDGDEGGDEILDSLAIQVVSNGWIITHVSEDEESYHQEVYTFTDGTAMLNAICNALGVTHGRSEPTK